MQYKSLVCKGNDPYKGLAHVHAHPLMRIMEDNLYRSFGIIMRCS
ncbi:MAG: hypothetical protein ACMUEL_00920 [Flavobacteriales bacterium Tduv]